MAHPKADFTQAQALVKFLFWNLHFKAAIVRLFLSQQGRFRQQASG
jgi:hypothetical protein